MFKGISGAWVGKGYVSAGSPRSSALTANRGGTGASTKDTCKGSCRLIPVRIADVTKRVECIAASGSDKVNGFAPNVNRSIGSIQRPMPRGEEDSIAATCCVNRGLDAGSLPRTPDAAVTATVRPTER